MPSPSPDSELTVTRSALLMNGTDATFREMLHDMLSLSSSLDHVRNRFGASLGLSGVQYTLLSTIRHLQGATGVGVKELAEQLRKVETERNELARQAAADGQGLKVCAQKNVQLAGIANEALDRYEKKGCFGALAQAEPFTGLKRIEVENAVEEYRQKVDSLQVPAADAGAPIFH